MSQFAGVRVTRFIKQKRYTWGGTMLFEQVDPLMTTTFHKAARDGNTETLKEIIRKKPQSINITDNRGWTSLHEAVFNNKTECVKIILNHDTCNVNARTYEGETPLYLGCSTIDGSADIILLLLGHSADVNLGNNEAETPLHAACRRKKTAVVQILLAAGADKNAKDMDFWTPLHTAADVVSLEVVKTLVTNGAAVEDTDYLGCTPLFRACVKQNLPIVEYLLYIAHASVDQQCNDGNTPLAVAVVLGRLDIVNVLLNAGADPCLNGGSIFLTAVRCNHFEILEKLLKAVDQTALKNVYTLKEFDLLYKAIDYGSVRCTEKILSAGLPHDFIHGLFKVPIRENSSFIRSQYTKMNALAFFLDSKLQLFRTSETDEPNTWLTQKEATEIFDLLINAGFSVNPTLREELPPLTACLSGTWTSSEGFAVHCAIRLLELGADVNYTTIGPAPDFFIYAGETGNVIALHHMLQYSFCTPDDILQSLLDSSKIFGSQQQYAFMIELLHLGVASQSLRRRLSQLVFGNQAHLPQYWRDVEKQEYMIPDQYFTLCSLQQLSRIAIRQHLHKISNARSPLQLISKFNIPALLKSYLMYQTHV